MDASIPIISNSIDLSFSFISITFTLKFCLREKIQVTKHPFCVKLENRPKKLHNNLYFTWNQGTNKKVLRERKRHTSRYVASARYAALSPDWGGGGRGTPSQAGPGGGEGQGCTPSQVLVGGGCPIQSWMGGVPHPRLGGGYPIQSWTWNGVLPIQTWDEVPTSPPAGWDTPAPKMWTDRHLRKQYLPSYFVRGR